MNNLVGHDKFSAVSVQGNIGSYGRVFKLNYEDIFNEKNSCGENGKGGGGGEGGDKQFYSLSSIGNKNIVVNKKDLDVYYLECLEILSVENWNKCFKINYPRKKVELNYPYFGEICCDIQKAFKGALNFTGKSFANGALIPGDLETYYFQYMAQKIFGSHLAFYGFENLPDIKKQISEVPKKILSVLQTRDVLKMFYDVFEKNMKKDGVRLNEYDLDYRNNVGDLEEESEKPMLFKKGDVIEFSVFIKKPNLELYCSKNLEKKMEKYNKKFSIKDSLWKIYFILL